MWDSVPALREVVHLHTRTGQTRAQRGPPPAGAGESEGRGRRGPTGRAQTHPYKISNASNRIGARLREQEFVSS
jgi:hypothetical protein